MAAMVKSDSFQNIQNAFYEKTTLVCDKDFIVQYFKKVLEHVE